MILWICLESLRFNLNCNVILFIMTPSIPDISRMPRFILIECYCCQEAVQRTNFGAELWERKIWFLIGVCVSAAIIAVSFTSLFCLWKALLLRLWGLLLGAGHSLGPHPFITSALAINRSLQFHCAVKLYVLNLLPSVNFKRPPWRKIETHVTHKLLL